MKRENHYHYATSDFKGDKLIPSKRLKITTCHSSYTTNTSTNNSMIKRNISLPDVQYPFILNSPSTEKILDQGKATEKPTLTFMGRITHYKIFLMLESYLFQIALLKIFTTTQYSMI